MKIRRFSFFDITLLSSDSIGGRPALRVTRAVKRLTERLLVRLITMRMQQAQGRVNAYLRSLDDERLAQLGFEPFEISMRSRSKYTGQLTNACAAPAPTAYAYIYARRR